MERMTWKEFKEAVDKALAEAGKSDDVTIGWMDMDSPKHGDFKNGDMQVFIHEETNEIVVY